MAIAENFDKLPDDVRKILFELKDKEDGSCAVGRAISYNYGKLPPDITNLLLELPDTDAVARYTILDGNLSSYPKTVKDELFRRSLQSERYGASIGEVMLNKYNDLSDDLRKLVFKFAAKKDTISYWQEKRTKSGEMELKSKRKNGGEILIESIFRNYDKLPTDVTNLLFEFANNKETVRYVDRLIKKKTTYGETYGKLPDNVRNDLRMRIKTNRNILRRKFFVDLICLTMLRKIPEKISKRLEHI